MRSRTPVRKEFEAQICSRLDYHDGPCNDYENARCALKHKLEREGKIMWETDSHAGFLKSKEQEETDVFLKSITRYWFNQLWYQLIGRA